MKISHRNVPYSAIPRLVQEGVIKVGTRVKACEDQTKYPNGCGELDNGLTELVTRINDNSFWIGRCNHFFTEDYNFLDILPDEEAELPPAKSLDFDAIAENSKKIDHLFKPKEGVFPQIPH